MRGIAVLAVVSYHWFRPERIPYFGAGGVTGVTIFFVLSGYLISSSCQRIDFADFRSGYLHFMLRRVLRIVPLYFTILILFAFFIRSNIGLYKYYFVFLSNFVFFTKGWFDHTTFLGFPIDLTPTWTLSIEWQFYLLAPMLFYFVSSRLIFCSIFTAIGLSCRLFSYFNSGYYSMEQLLTPFAFDALGFGALLSLVKGNGIKPAGRLLGAVLVGLAVVTGYLCVHINSHIGLLYPTALAGLSSASIYALVCQGERFNIMKRCIGCRPLAYVGMISYSVYLLHMPVFYGYKWLFHLGRDYREYHTFLAFGLLLVVCSITYFLIEEPFQHMSIRNRIR